MAILVDELREYPGTSRCRSARGATWPRTAAFDELHAFAARLGPPARVVPGRPLRPAAARPGGGGGARGGGGRDGRSCSLRMAGPRGERARRRSLAPAGVAWLRGGAGPARAALPARGRSSRSAGRPGRGSRRWRPAPPAARRARARSRRRCGRGTGGEWGDALRTLAGGAGGGARDGRRARSRSRPRCARGIALAMTKAAAAAGVEAHLVLVDAVGGGVPRRPRRPGRRADRRRAVRASPARVGGAPAVARERRFCRDFHVGDDRRPGGRGAHPAASHSQARPEGSGRGEVARLGGLLVDLGDAPGERGPGEAVVRVVGAPRGRAGRAPRAR